MSQIKQKNEKRYRRQRRRISRGSMFLVTGMLLILTTVLSVNSMRLSTKIKENEQTQVKLQLMIDDEKTRSKEIKEFEGYAGSKEYIEDTAREKLGLVYDNEIIFRAR